MSKKRDEAAPSEPERSETIDEREDRELAELEAFEAAQAAEAARLAQPIPVPAKGPETFEQWAEAKGHIKRLPPPGRPRAAYVQPGPDFRVVKVATQWPANKVVTEDEYDKAVVKTYGADIRER